MEDTILTTLGLLLIATSLTLMVFSPRTWLVAFAHGFGIQAIVGACASAAQVCFFIDGIQNRPMYERIKFAVEGLPFHAAGWSAKNIYDAAMVGPPAPASHHLDQYLPVAAIQMTVIAGIIAYRKMLEHDILDPVLILIVLVLCGNSGGNVMSAWWG